MKKPVFLAYAHSLISAFVVHCLEFTVPIFLVQNGIADQFESYLVTSWKTPFVMTWLIFQGPKYMVSETKQRFKGAQPDRSKYLYHCFN